MWHHPLPAEMTSSKWSEMCHSISPEMQPRRGWSESGSSDADLFMEHCPKNVPITHVDCSPMDYLPGVQSNLPHCQPQKDLEKSHSSLMWLKSSIFPGRNIICIPIKYCVPTIKSLEDGIHLISKVLNYSWNFRKEETFNDERACQSSAMNCNQNTFIFI